jgi:hypothetical protein
MATGPRGDSPSVRDAVLKNLVAKRVAQQRGQSRDPADRPASLAPPAKGKARSIAAIQPRSQR